MFFYCCLLEIIEARIAGFFRERRWPSSRAVDGRKLFIVFSCGACLHAQLEIKRSFPASRVFYRRDAEARRRCFVIVVYWK